MEVILLEEEYKSEVTRPRKRRKATTPEGRENQLISLAYDVAEEQLLNGTASAMVITHYLKLGTTRSKLEEEKLRKENNLLEARVEDIQSRKTTEALYKEALQAMRSYQGQEPEAEDEDV